MKTASEPPVESYFVITPGKLRTFPAEQGWPRAGRWEAGVRPGVIVSSASQRHTVRGDTTRPSATLTPAPGLHIWPRDGTP